MIVLEAYKKMYFESVDQVYDLNKIINDQAVELEDYEQQIKDLQKKDKAWGRTVLICAVLGAVLSAIILNQAHCITF